MTFMDFLYQSPIISLLQPWASKVWSVAKANNSAYGNSTVLQSYLNNTTNSGKYSETDIKNLISAHKTVRTLYPSIPVLSKEFTDKMILVSPEMKKFSRTDLSGIRLLVSQSVYKTDGAVYDWLNGSDNDGVISKLKAYYEKANADASKTREYVTDKVVSVAEGSNEDLQKYLKYGTFILGSIVILKALGIVKDFFPKK